MGGGVPGCHSMASAARALRRVRYSGSTAPGWLSLRWTVTSPSPERVTGAYSWASSNIAASGGVRTPHSAPSFDGCRTRVATSSRWTGLVLKSGLHALNNSCTPFGQFERARPSRRMPAHVGELGGGDGIGIPAIAGEEVGDDEDHTSRHVGAAHHG